MFTDVKQQQTYKVKQRFEQGRVSGDPLMTNLSQAPYPHSNFSFFSYPVESNLFGYFQFKHARETLALWPSRVTFEEAGIPSLPPSPLYPPPLSRPGDVLKSLKTSLIFRRISHEMYLRLCDLCNSTLRANFSFFTKALTSFVKVKVR